MKTTANEIMPFEPTHPGEIIKEELEARNISQKKFASTIGVSYTMLNEILNGHRSVTADFALIIEAALGVSADMFNNMQARYDMIVARRDTSKASRLDAIRKMCASVL